MFWAIRSDQQIFDKNGTVSKLNVLIFESAFEVYGVSSVDEFWPTRIVQESFWCESSMRPETVFTGFFKNNCLLPLMF